jgi:hypothetical protein
LSTTAELIPKTPSFSQPVCSELAWESGVKEVTKPMTAGIAAFIGAGRVGRQATTVARSASGMPPSLFVSGRFTDFPDEGVHSL